MANAVVRGGAPAIEVAGSLSDGIFFQNLGTNPIYIGSAPYVSATACDGVIQPGGSYTVGKGRNVYLYADVDAAVVWSFGLGTAADAGNTVNASVAGSVAVTSAPPVTGAVSPTQKYSTLFNRGPISVPNAPGTFNISEAGIIGQTDVSTQQSLILAWNIYDNSTSFLVTGFRVFWYDTSGNLLFDEFIPGYAFGGLYCVTPVKGARVAVNAFVDSALFGAGTYTFNPYIGTSTLLLPEQYYTAPGVQTGTGPTPTWQNVVQGAFDVRIGSVQRFAGNGSDNRGNCSWLTYAPTLGRLVNGVFNVQITGTTSQLASLDIMSWSPGAASGSGPGVFGMVKVFRSVVSSTGTTQSIPFTAQLPKAPMALWLQGVQTTGSVGADVSLAYERY